MSWHLQYSALAATLGLIATPFILVPPLLATLVVELPVAAFFRIGNRGLVAVLWVNVVTNPVFNVILFSLYGLGIGLNETYVPLAHPGPNHAVVHAAPVYWVIVAAMEVAIVFVEWRLLVWALRRTAGSASRLFAMSACMNAVSALISLWWAFAMATRTV
jgi:hypothetical protein